MAINIDAYCEECGEELNIYLEMDGDNFRVTPCRNCIGQRDALQAKLEIAKEVIENLLLQSGAIDASSKPIGRQTSWEKYAIDFLAEMEA